MVRERVQLTTLPFDAFPELALVFHASELRLLFGPVPHSSVELEFANRMLDFYINFINDLNPGRMSSSISS